MRRLDRAKIIRRQVLEVMGREGRWREVQGSRSRVCAADGWTASLYTPFNPLHDARIVADTYQKALLLQQVRLRPWLLDVWIPGVGKVLSLGWDDTEVELISMKRGWWEQELFGLPPR